MTTCCPDEIVGATPAKIKWQVVRGDSSSLLVLFYEADEETGLATESWSYLATAYDPASEDFFDLAVEAVEGGAIIHAESEQTALWGTTYGGRVAELHFDLEVTYQDGVVWTPVTGVISVLGDVSGGALD
jgi:hypothetical protein